MPGDRIIRRFFAAIIPVVLFFQAGFAGAANDPAAAAPLKIAIGQTLLPDQENQPAEVEGLVTFVGKHSRTVYLEISSEAGYMPVNVATGAAVDNRVSLLLRSQVRIHGVCSSIRSSSDGKMVAGLQVSNLDDIVVLQPPEEAWQRFPLVAINAATNVSGQVFHLRGKIRVAEPGQFFSLDDGSGRITAHSTEITPAMIDHNVEMLGVWQPQGSVFQSIYFRPVAGTNGRAGLPVLTTTEQIRWLKPDEAARKYPVNLRGVITYIRSDRRSGNIHDGTGDIFMWRFDQGQGQAAAKPGDFCEISGITSPGDISPTMHPTKVTVLGQGQFPEPIEAGWEELIRGNLDAQWVAVHGVVLSITNRIVKLEMKGGPMLCSFPDDFDPEEVRFYLGAVAQVRGVVIASHSRDRHVIGVQLAAFDKKFISVEVPAPTDLFSAPTFHAQDLFTYHPDDYAFQRIKISGQVVHYRDGICYLMDGTNGMRLLPAVRANVAAGDLVEAVGFLGIQNPFDRPLLTLREAVVRQTGRALLSEAVLVRPEQLLDRGHDATRVRIESQLAGVAKYSNEQVFELQNGSMIYRARLDLKGEETPLSIPVGSRLELTGVYAAAGNDKSGPFELLLNSPADIRVLALPPWWTARHALMVVSAMAVTIFLGLVWIALLRRQVDKRTAQLSAANRLLKREMTERERAESELILARTQHAIEQERTRIARDLHDDLGSRVTRVVLLLDELALQDRLPVVDSPEHPRGISAAARDIIQSLDETVWAVNPGNDSLPHLFNYISHFAIEFLQFANVRCRLDFPDHLPTRFLSTEARHNLFLVVKEALNNAVRHGRPTEVWLRGTIDDGAMTLVVEDNGAGFSTAPDHPSADGLRNMRERMKGIGGRLEVESAPGAGTKVTLAFSWPPE